MGQFLLLGGTGWVGSFVARHAVEEGWEVTCLARGASGAFPSSVRVIRADRTEPDAYRAALDQDWDVVVDLSWQPGQVRSALEALAGRARRWIYVSSVSVYASHAVLGGTEERELLPPADTDDPGVEEYGPAKVACEQLTVQALSDRALIVRPGLIIGPGDDSDRFGYWASRFALAGDAQVLVPDAADQPTQGIDVRDLARWLVLSAQQPAVHGPVNAVGRPLSLGDVLAMCQVAAGFSGTAVAAGTDFLSSHEVAPWAGPRSLPLWMPGREFAGFGSYLPDRYLVSGGRHRRLEETIADVLSDERARGLDRDRSAGLERSQELELLAAIG